MTYRKTTYELAVVIVSLSKKRGIQREEEKGHARREKRTRKKRRLKKYSNKRVCVNKGNGKEQV